MFMMKILKGSLPDQVSSTRALYGLKIKLDTLILELLALFIATSPA